MVRTAEDLHSPFLPGQEVRGLLSRVLNHAFSQSPYHGLLRRQPVGRMRLYVERYFRRTNGYDRPDAE